LTAPRTNLGQKEAGQEKKKKSDLSNMGVKVSHIEREEAALGVVA
jgi:hypothetical protein